MDRSKDAYQRRCPRLGGPVSFAYCRTESGHRQPCWKVVDCWWECFDVTAFLKANLTNEQFNRICTGSPPQPKITSLLEMIEKARRNVVTDTRDEC